LSHNADSIIRTSGYFSVHPNVAYGTFQVILNDKELIGNAILLVKDANGKETLKRAVEVKPGINFFSLNDPKFAQGNYFIFIESPILYKTKLTLRLYYNNMYSYEAPLISCNFVSD